MDIRLFLVVAGWLVGWWLLWRVPSLRIATSTPRPTRATRPALVSACTVIIPARNEEQSIANLLASLLEQTVAPAQILVVDDQSDDETAAIARHFASVTVVSGEPVPPGWTGKAWACHQGAQLASGDVLVFLDADVVLAPDGLAALLDRHAGVGGLLSVQPYHRMERTYERLSALFNIIGFMGVGAASPGRDGRAHGAFGPCLVTSRHDYDVVGGHGSVRGEIIEDIAMSHEYEHAHLPVHIYGGGDAISFRMYPGGVGQLVEGWSKNFATGAGNVGPIRLLLVGFWVTCTLISVQYVIEAAFGSPDIGRGAILFVYVLFAVQLGAMLRPLGNFGWLTALVYPGPLGIFVVVFARSAYLTLVRRRVIWRGRPIPLSRPRRWSQAPAPTDE